MSRRPRQPGSIGRRSLLAAIALGASVALAACGSGAGAAGGDGAAAPVATTTVDLPKSYTFEPAAIAVDVGATVTWTNNDNFTHNVAFDGEQPLQMAPGEQVQRTFDAAGTFAYVCSLHPQDMQGTVVVGS